MPVSSHSTESNGRFVALEPVVDDLWDAAIASSTKSTYTTGFNFFIRFLLMTGVIACANNLEVQVTEDLLIYFAAHCFNSSLSYSTIKLYLCGVRFMCLRKNILYPIDRNLSRLYSVLNGIKRLHSNQSRPRHPVTYNVLSRLCVFLRNKTSMSFMDMVLETTCIIAFFGFLRCGEFTVKGGFDSSIHLCVNDLSILEDSVVLNLKASKTDPFRRGVAIKLFKIDNQCCPYTACCKYIKIRLSQGPSPLDPLFVDTTGSALSRNKFIAMFKLSLKSIGIDPDMYNGHSFRIGAATTAASVKLEDHLIKVLGRWSSDAYCRYIKTPVSAIRQAQISMTCQL